jgi:hypothetical protein
MPSAEETPFQYLLTNTYKGDLIVQMGSHPEFFTEALQLAVSNVQPYGWRAAWLLWSCMTKNDPRVQGSIPMMLEALPQREDGHQRELLKVLYMMELDEEQEGRLFDLCAGIWEQAAKSPGVRMNALKHILKIAAKYPELKNEIAFLVQSHYLDSLSPGARRSAIRMVREVMED